MITTQKENCFNNGDSNQLDKEWLSLILIAKSQGLTAQEVESFFKKHQTFHNNESENA
ncbi:anti-repressor SinI family protein [Aquibacillus rhizosphaerae]|uniref:Anti-repressor SinI family protein n=1 Tax=Aquibacillus rhizosphaerae TaxID=3051431 RepID=A0ABT7L007_9BACI|nr:anti-repressor SinI family protein [Aquibacillus sp. LR5S19]MDL4839068.1 anti-repressor SinI family protein [Aquibacillus sp. LR5S19]